MNCRIFDPQLNTTGTFSQNSLWLDLGFRTFILIGFIVKDKKDIAFWSTMPSILNPAQQKGHLVFAGAKANGKNYKGGIFYQYWRKIEENHKRY